MKATVEAIMWFSANNELLMFLFGGSVAVVLDHAVGQVSDLAAQAGRLRHRAEIPLKAWPQQIAGLLFFILALLSKESAYIFLPLFLVTIPPEELWRRCLATHLLPYVALASVAVVSVALTRAHSFRFTDGSFSLQRPFLSDLAEKRRKSAVVLGPPISCADSCLPAPPLPFANQPSSRSRG